MGKHKTPAEREIALRVGARIRQLREVQHISQIHLATDIGIRAGPLGWIEKGKHLPSGRVLYRIAKQLNVRLDDLFQETDVWQPSAPAVTDTTPTMLPPCDMNAPTESVKAAHIVCQSVADRLAELEKFCGSAKVSELPLCTPVVATEAGAESLAGWVRQRLGVGDAVVSDYLELLEDAGLRMVFLDMPDGCSTFSGYDHVNRNACIFLNIRLKKQPELLVYRLAFELGRIYWYTCKQFGTDAAALVPSGETALDEASFAHRFAAAFLMPAPTLQKVVGQLKLAPKAWSWDLLLRFKKRYGVSAQCMAMRLQSLKLSWSDKQKKSPRYFLFKDELDAYAAENGANAEPGGSRSQLTMNGALCTLMLCAEQVEGRDQKALNAIKRVLRQACVKLDA